jgi:4-amino-4-deoxy-L-arabinose transferase-like glycosyltransferase
MIKAARFPPRAARRPRLALMLSAGAAAVVAQAIVSSRPWASLFLFAGAMIAFGASAPAEEEVEEPEEGGRAPWPHGFWPLFLAGTLLCATSGAAVYLGMRPLVTHGTWLLGLAAYAGAAARTWRRGGRRRSRRRTAAAVVLLVVVSGLLFGWRLTSLPPEVHGDDAEVGLDAIDLIQRRPFNLFKTSWFDLPRFHAVPTAIGLEIFGINLLGLRATSFALGVATVLLLFGFAKRLWGYETALLAALLLASMRFFIHLSRTGFHYVDTPFLSVLAAWLFVRLWRDRHLGAAVCCGIAVGLGIQTYYASRIVPVLLLVTWLMWLIGTAREDLPARIAGFAVLSIAALATAAPMIGYFVHQPAELWRRTADTSIFSAQAWPHVRDSYKAGSLLTVVLIQLRAALSLFNLTPDTSLQYGYHGPLLEPVSAVLFVLGVGLAAARSCRRHHQLLLLWTALPLIAGAALTIDAPFYPRISGILPFVAVLAALPLRRLSSALRVVVPGSAGRWGAGLAAAGLLVAIFSNNLRSYFLEYSPSHRLSPAVEISAWIREHGAGKTTYMVGGAPAFFIRHGTIRFLTHGYDTRDIRDLARHLRSQKLDPARSVFIVMPRGKDLIPRLLDAVGPARVDTQRNERGEILFYTVVPDAAAPPRSAARRAPPLRVRGPFGDAPRLRERLSAALRYSAMAGVALLALAIAAGSAFRALPAPRGRRGRRTPHAPRADPRPATRWRRIVFGPDERERQLRPPRPLVWSLLGAVLLVAVTLRVYRLSELPAGFYCDEAGLGYNACSILRSGRDETGTFLPLYVWSFNVSYKNPVFLYSSMIPIALLGPTDLAVRLTSALYGAGTVALAFFVGRALMGPWAGLLAALFLAVCPWHLHFSRIAFELVTFPFFFLLGLLELLRYARGKRTLTQAMVALGLSLYTYAPAKLFVPLFGLGFAALYAPLLLRRWKESLLALVVLATTISPAIIFDVTHQRRAGSYFRHTTILEQNLAPGVLAGRFVRNYAAFLSPRFLFERGDHVTRHAVRDHGELYWFFAPFLLAGVAVCAGRRDRALLLPLWWLALYPIAPALMNEIPSASRGFIGAAGFCLLAAIGAAGVLRLATRVSRRRPVANGLQLVAVAAGLVFLVPQVRHYWKLYSEKYPLYSAEFFSGFQFGNRQAVEYFVDRRDDYDRMILTPRKSNQPQIFLQFYAGLRGAASPGVPPFPAPDEMQVAWPEDLSTYRNEERLLMAVRPEELVLFGDYDVKKEIVAPNGEPAFVLADVHRLKDFVTVWLLAGTDPPKATGPPPAFDPAQPPATDAHGHSWRRFASPHPSVRPQDVYGVTGSPRCAWAVNFVYSDTDREALVAAGFDDDGAVWIDGEPVSLAVREPQSDIVADTATGPVHLHAGRNTVAVRTCHSGARWLFFFRLAGADGGPLRGIDWEYRPD